MITIIVPNEDCRNRLRKGLADNSDIRVICPSVAELSMRPLDIVIVHPLVSANLSIAGNGLLKEIIRQRQYDAATPKTIFL